VPNEDDRLALRVDDALGGVRVALERKRRILDNADGVAVLLELAIDTPQPDPSTNPP
jgi:hypothetical protein